MASLNQNYLISFVECSILSSGLQGDRDDMTSRRATLPSEAEVTQAVANEVPDLAGFVGVLLAFDAKGADGFHWYVMPGQHDLGEDDDPVHVLLNENNVAMLLFKDEKDVVIGAPAVASALATKKSRGGQVLERSALLGAIFFSAVDDAGEKGDELGDTLEQYFS